MIFKTTSKKKQTDLEKFKQEYNIVSQCECGRELKEHNKFFFRCSYCAKLYKKKELKSFGRK